LDAICLYKAARFLKQDVAALDHVNAHMMDDSPSSNNSQEHNHVHAQVSRKMDRVLRRNSRPSPLRTDHPILVSLLYVLTVLTSACSLASFGIRCYASTARAHRVCQMSYRSEHRRHTDDQGLVNSLPDALHEWVLGAYSSSWDDDKSLDLIHMVDGTTFLSGQENITTSQGNDLVTRGHGSHASSMILVSTSVVGTLRFYSEVRNPQLFNILGENYLASKAMCCLYDADSYERKRPFSDSRTRALCISAYESSWDLASFRNVSLDSHPRGKEWRKASASSRAYNGSLYHYSVWYKTGGQGARYDQDGVIEIYKLDPATMAIESISNSSVSRHYRYSDVYIIFDRRSECFVQSQMIACCMLAVVVIFAYFWLYHCNHMASGLAPACMALFTVLLLIHNDFAYGLGYCAVFATTVSLLNVSPPRTEREALVWIHYSILTVFSVYELVYDRSAMIFMGLLAGAFLGHPVVEMVGGLVSIGAVTALIWSLLLEPQGVHNVLLKVPFLVVGGCGLVSIGRCVTKHRAFLYFYFRHLWRAEVSTWRGGRNSGRMSISNPLDSRSDAVADGMLTRGLLSSSEFRS
jgi:hypothetical protein